MPLPYSHTLVQFQDDPPNKGYKVGYLLLEYISNSKDKVFYLFFLKKELVSLFTQPYPKKKCLYI